MGKKFYLLSIIVVLTMVLGACQPAATPVAAPTQPPAAPAQPAQPAQPTQAPVAAPTQPPAPAAAGELVTYHYWTDDMGKAAWTKIFGDFSTKTGVKISEIESGHEDFKTNILVLLASDNPPDVFSYWAGARTQFVTDAGSLQAIDDIWASDKMDEQLPAALVKKASMVNGKHYLVPVGYHMAAFWYNKKVMDKVGITQFPKTWDEFKAMCKKIKDAGIAPIALGSKNRWPAQFFFDYLILRTAGPDFRQQLMDGKVPYTAPEVVKAMELWKELYDAGYFVPNANAYDWTDALDQVAKGEAAMSLMGTWATGYFNTNLKMKPVDDYDYFAFPEVTPGVPQAVVGPVDGFVMSAKSKNPDNAKKMLQYLLTPEVQKTWALEQGCLAPNVKTDQSIYTPVLKKAVADVAAAADYAFNYDLATTPPMAEGGLNMFAQFMNDPSKFNDYLKQTEDVAKDVFKKQ